MRKRTDPVEAVFADTAGAWHPVHGPLNVALNRIAALERRVDFLSRRVDVLVDLLNESDTSE